MMYISLTETANRESKTMGSNFRMMDGHFYHGDTRTAAEIEVQNATSTFNWFNKTAQVLTGNIAVSRSTPHCDWMVYDIANGHCDAVYIGMIPAVFANAATAAIIAE